METTIFLFIGLIVLFYGWYISIIIKRNNVLRALSGIDVQLKKRSNLLPGILKIAKNFMEKEIKLLENVTAMRSKAQADYDPKNSSSVKEHLKHVGQLDRSLSQLMINVENYPQLKSDQTMINAQQTFNEVEEHIAAARRFYNASVTTFNNTVEIFPGNILAKAIGMKPMPFYESDESSKQDVNVDDYL